KGLTLRGADPEYRSPKFWDVWQDVPCTFFGQLDDPKKATEVRGWLKGRGEYVEALSPLVVAGPVVYRAWARSRLLDLEDLFLVGGATPRDLVDLSVDAQVLCRFTAFTAIDKASRVNTEQHLHKIVQPVESTIQPVEFVDDGLFEQEPVDDGLFEQEPVDDGLFTEGLRGIDFGSAPPARAKRPAAPDPNDAQWIKRQLQRDTLLYLGEMPSKSALGDCLEIVKALLKEVTERLRDGSLSSADDRWREFVAKLMDYQEALEEAIKSGLLKPARQLRKELEAMLHQR
ncbi:MAG: hypothetical protein WC423_13055, partial [Vulcanimicrobiota bacterium]